MKRFCLAITLVLATAALSAQGIYLTSQERGQVRYHYPPTGISVGGNTSYGTYFSSSYSTPTYSVSSYSVQPINYNRYTVRLNKIGADNPVSSSVGRRREGEKGPPQTDDGVRDPNSPGWGGSGGSPGNDGDDHDPDNPGIGVGGAPGYDDDINGPYDPDGPQFGPIGDGLWVMLLLLVVYMISFVRKRKKQIISKTSI